MRWASFARVWAGAMIVVGLLVGPAMGARAQGVAAQGTAKPLGAEAAQGLAFDVATIKPSKSAGYNIYFITDRFTAVGANLLLLVQEAYGAYNGNYVMGGPPWAAKDTFDVEAKINPEEIPKFGELTLAQRREMLKKLLAERFALKVHSETREVSGYGLQLVSTGAKFGKPVEHAENFNGIEGYHCMVRGTGIRGYVKMTHCDVDALAGIFTNYLAPKVVNQTGLTALYDYELRWRPDDAAMVHGGVVADPETENYPALPTALREQLGLKLVPIKAPVEVIVIDHAERPTEN